MKMKTVDLTGRALDAAVMLARGFAYQSGMPESERTRDSDCLSAVWRKSPGGVWACMRCHEDAKPSTDWAEGGPIIEREGINIRFIRCNGHSMDGQAMAAYDGTNTGTMVQWVKRTDWPRRYWIGPAPLIAAMRCYVAAKLGDEVDVPDGCLKETT